MSARQAGKLAQEFKLMFGFLFSLKDLVSKVTPPARSAGFYACSTTTFKLNYYEAASGLRFVMSTELGAGDMREPLRRIFSNICVEVLREEPAVEAGRRGDLVRRLRRHPRPVRLHAMMVCRRCAR